MLILVNIYFKEKYIWSMLYIMVTSFYFGTQGLLQLAVLNCQDPGVSLEFS